MAVPDPHISEMRIMAYEKRKRACKTAHPVPHRGEYIDVLWCMDHLAHLPERWCAAEILHVSATPEQDYLARSVILYLPTDSWAEQTHEVGFLRYYKLRRAAETEDENEEQEDEIPILYCRHSREREDIEEEHDRIWVPTNEKDRDTLSRANPNHNLAPRSDKEITTLRNGHAAAAVEIQKLKRAVSSLSSQVYQLQRNSTLNQICTDAGCVIPRLRHKLILTAQNSPRPMQLSSKKRKVDTSEQNFTSTGDGIHVGILKAKVECSLRQFEDLACHIQASCSPHTVFFFPPFQQTQQPLHCSDEFLILFSTFADLATHIGISSKSHRLEIARKCGSGPQGELLRLLGTYRFDSEDNKMAAENFPGASCRICQLQENTVTQVSGAQQPASQPYPVLYRKSREWKSVGKCFVHELCLGYTSLPELDESCTEHHAFQLQWRRAPDVSTRLWSRAIADSPHVHGWLEVMLPFVQTQGRHLCVEVGGMASDDVWDKIL